MDWLQPFAFASMYTIRHLVERQIELLAVQELFPNNRAVKRAARTIEAFHGLCQNGNIPLGTYCTSSDPEWSFLVLTR